jgi:hypothetical protein
MTKSERVFGVICLTFFALIFAANTNAQGKQVFTGTVLSYGTGANTRSVTRTFTLTINGQTSDSLAQEYLNTLQSGGQDDVLAAIKKQDLGSFSVGANVGVTINVVRESVEGNTRKIFIVFERWTQFAEYRGGYRSLDYPFGVIELTIDEKTGKGEGTYIAAAQIRWKKDKKTNGYQVEIENFATYPAKLLGVQLRGKG